MAHIVIEESEQELRPPSRPQGREPRDRGEGVRDAAGAVGLRQDDDAAPARGLPRARRGRDPGRGPAALLAADHRPARAAPDGHGVPELCHLAAYERVRQCRLRPQARQARARRDPRAGRPGARGDRPRRARRAASGAAERRPAAAGGARPLARGRAFDPAARRAALESGCQAARADAQRAQEPAAAHRHHLRLRHPRPGGGDGAVRSDRRVPPGRAAAVRATARDLRAARPTCSSPTSWAS